ncbi:hypothetical protein [Fusobacterium mortiferum]|uniref:hypothetical protein n=1 Tax=Fusobacterium mortiferum TaxID=850 RepID=UPI001F21B6A0|nr:hypothetical protein [Fusobacterium mortiferum]MCF2698650.1 hypothetical protein [Fusobacterium mortiferum]
MRNKIVATIFLVASVILVIKSLNPLKIYNFVEKGNSFIKEEKYSNGREEYENALKLRENNQVKLNVLKSFYSEKNYEEVTKSNVEEGFLKGNSYVYLGDNSQDKNKEFYEKALEEYKLAMKTSDDINIKKNYELTLKKLEDMSNQQNQEDKQEKQNKENQNNNNQNQQNNSQENPEQNQNSKDNNNSQNQEDKSSQSNEKNQSSNNKEQEKKENSSQEKQNNEKEQESNSQPNEQNNKQNEDNTQENENQNESSDKKENNQNSNTAPQNMKEPSQEEIREQEVRAILKRLEGNEKQSFKNNERVMDINSNNPSNRW